MHKLGIVMMIIGVAATARLAARQAVKPAMAVKEFVIATGGTGVGALYVLAPKLIGYQPQKP